MHHLAQSEQSKVVSELQENLYVDDWLSGANSELEAKSMVNEALEVMEGASMCLTKWESNKSFVVDKAEPSDYVKVLGMGWRSADDHFAFEGFDFGSDLRISKRVVLSLIARMFDPLGFLNPFVVFLKVLFQELWKEGLDWDEQVPESVEKQVKLWLDSLSDLRLWSFPRCYFDQPWLEHNSIELHGFCDSSEKAYGCCVYLVLRTESEVKSSLVISKVKVAPVKRVTLPRLELLGAVLLARQLRLVREALCLKESVVSRYWTDSMVVLGWIRGDPSRWKQFVANRVEQIQDLSDPSQWSHCPGETNPADLVTRGILAQELMRSDLWLKGPLDLFMGDGVETDFDIDSTVNSACRSEVLLSVSTPDLSFVELDRWGSLTKALRIMGWIGRFVSNCRVAAERRQLGDLSFEELEKGKILLFRVAQRQVYAQEVQALEQNTPLSKRSTLFHLSPLLDDNGLLRIKGRLDNAELCYSEKHPVIVPKGHLADLVVRFQHILLALLS